VWTLGSDIWTLSRIPGVRGVLRRTLAQANRCFADGIELARQTSILGGREVEFLPSTRRISGRRTSASRTAPPYRLLFLGRWHRNKGVDLLLEALGLIKEADWRRIAAVDVCGGGPLHDEVMREVGKLRAAGRPVSSRGYLDKAAAEEAILAADYLLIPSRIESIPVVFSDAMKLACPVVCTPVGDLPNLVADAPACGIVASDIDAQAFANALSMALARSPAEFLDATRSRAAQFDLSAIALRIARELGNA
jgi:glycosyltransferase involved in cell wall biosynthesis